jgi:hypothetical protein
MFMNPTTQQEDDRALSDEELNVVSGGSLRTARDMFPRGSAWYEFFDAASVASSRMPKTIAVLRAPLGSPLGGFLFTAVRSFTAKQRRLQDHIGYRPHLAPFYARIFVCSGIGYAQARIWIRQSEQVLYQALPNFGVSSSRPLLQQAECQQNGTIGWFYPGMRSSLGTPAHPPVAVYSPDYKLLTEFLVSVPPVPEILVRRNPVGLDVFSRTEPFHNDAS